MPWNKIMLHTFYNINNIIDDINEIIRHNISNMPYKIGTKLLIHEW